MRGKNWPTLKEIWGQNAHIYPSIDAPRLSRQGEIQFPLYKAGEARWVQKFFDDGSLRIGTIWDFRRAEYGERIGDDTEGLQPLIFPDPIEGVLVAAPLNAKDSYVFCMSADCDEERFAKDGYDAAYRINHPAFFQEIALVLETHNRIAGACLMPVAYTDDDELEEFVVDRRRRGLSIERAVPWVGGLKPNDHVYPVQREIRAVFEPLEDANRPIHLDMDKGISPGMVRHWALIRSSLAPLTINVPSARNYAERVF